MLRSLLISSITCLIISPAAAQRILPVGWGVSSSSFSGIYSMVEQDGLAVIGGRFFNFNEHIRPNLQAWDGTQHFDLPGAFEANSHRVYSLAVHEGDLIAGGVDPGYGNIARWDGSDWSPFGNGFTTEVRQIKVFGDQLYVISTDNAVHHWNGSEWAVLGAVFNGPVRVIEEFQGTLYAGGDFTTTSDGTQLWRLARWNGNAWEQAGEGFNGEVRSLKTIGTELFIGGAFTADGNGQLTFPGWCRYDGSAFVPGNIDAGENGVFGFGEFDTDGLLLVFGSSTTMVLGPEGVTEIPWGPARAALQYNDLNLLAAGDNEGDFRHRIQGIAHVEPTARNHAANDLNSIHALVSPLPSLFEMRSYSGGFEVPKGSGHRLINSVRPMLRGEMDGVNYYSTYFGELLFGPDTLEFAGPRADDMSEEFYQRYHRVWKLDRAQILAHQQLWSDPNYQAPYDLTSWPVHGDGTNGEPSMISPFVDLNGNGLYEPEAGDHPKLKGDRSTYHISHTVDRAWYNGQHLPIDIHVETYAYGDPDPAIQHTLFATYRLINRSDNAYENVRFALFADMAIGSPYDDLVGCDTTRNLFFNYNGYDVDAGNILRPGYDERPPAIGVKFLNVPLASHRRFVRLGNTNGIDPDQEIYINDHMDGTLSGQPFNEEVYPMHFQFPGGELVDDLAFHPYPELNSPRSVAGTGPFSFGPGDTLCFDLAFIYARTAQGGALASLEDLKLRADSVQAFYNAMAVACSDYPIMTSIREQEDEHFLQLFPNPARSEVTVQASSPIRHLRVLDAQGREVRAMYGTSDRMTIGVSDLSAGLYFIQVLNDHGMRAMRLVVE